MDRIREAIASGASQGAFEKIEIPTSYRAACVRRADEKMFEGQSTQEKDPRRSIIVQDVPTPEIAPDEVLIAVMASSINFNTVWSSIFEPVKDRTTVKRMKLQPRIVHMNKIRTVRAEGKQNGAMTL